MEKKAVRAVRLEQLGGPEVLQLVNVELGQPGPGEVMVRHHAVGLNYIDVYGLSLIHISEPTRPY